MDFGGPYNNVESIDLSGFDLSDITSFSYVFYSCDSLKSVKFGDKLPTNLTTISTMFQGCESLEIIDLSALDFSKVKYVQMMFQGCTNLKSVNFGNNFSFKSLEQAWEMFKDCNALKSVSLGKDYLSNIKSMTKMFEGCTSLMSVDLSKINIVNNPTMSRLFADCTNLNKVTLGDKFKNWSDDGTLPVGTWVNKEKGLEKSEHDLYVNYGAKASEWCGIWEKILPAPQLKSIFNVKNGIDIRFEEVENATSYISVRVTGGREIRIAEVKDENIPEKYGYKNWTDTSVKSQYGTGFGYTVIAKNEYGESEYSKDYLLIFRLNEPSINKIEVKSKSSIKASWNKEKVHKYILQYSTDGTNWKTIETTATSKTINGLKSNTTYYFRVRRVMIQKDGTIHYSQYSTRKSARTK